jgi:hypothetical protein
MCGKEVVITNEHDYKDEKDQQEPIEEQIDGTCYTFDTADCYFFQSTE